MKTTTILSNARDCFIELTHNDSDSGLWIVRRWKKILWFKKRISSDWFNDERQAMAFAHELKRVFESPREGKEMLHHAT